MKRHMEIEMETYAGYMACYFGNVVTPLKPKTGAIATVLCCSI